MKNEKQEQLNAMRFLFLAVAVLSALSIAAFSLQMIYADDLAIETEKSYGIFQNDVFQDTGEVLVPSPYAVEKITMTVQNNGNHTRDFSLSMDYAGTIMKTEPVAEVNSTALTWNVSLPASAKMAFSIIGKGLEADAPSVIIATPSGQSILQPTNKVMILENASNKSTPPARFGYVREQENGIAGAVLAEQKRLDLATKSAIVVFAGLVILTFASGFAFVFGVEERPKLNRKVKIHISNIYHDNPKTDEFSKYKYEESEYWK